MKTIELKRTISLKKIIILSIILFVVNLLMPVRVLSQGRVQSRYRGGQQDRVLNVVCSFSDFATIAEYIGGNKVKVSYIAQGEQDPHFVPPKPSYAVMLSQADMWISTGMDLEMWSATLLDKARNRRIMDGEVGFVSAADGVNVVEKVEFADRTEGDVHLMGNPHVNTGPLNLKILAQNITIGFTKVDPANASFYQANRDAFIERVDRALFGDKLVDLFGGNTLSKLLDNGTLFTFLERSYEGGKLSDHLGGWLKKALPFRGMRIITYHKNWSYFAKTFGVEVVGYIEPKPGIPPSAKHVQNIIETIKQQNIKLMMVASYFEKKTAQMIEEKTGIKPVYLPLYVNGVPGIDDNFKLVDYWIDQINGAL
ncbi:MAG: metal ABC transporter substrate-binding protein [Bacteroidales bacterium]|jgi:ABC-type Zn uptake system ZnuABC Zn-binding protein ZnuA|nr:metal ABC transporter substrate-binding protein [Bacteroidales bacterium]